MNVYKNKKPAWVFLIPAFLFMAVFLYYPFLQNIVNSFMKIRNLGGGVKGVNNPFYKNFPGERRRLVSFLSRGARL